MDILEFFFYWLTLSLPSHLLLIHLYLNFLPSPHSRLQKFFASPKSLSSNIFLLSLINCPFRFRSACTNHPSCTPSHPVLTSRIACPNNVFVDLERSVVWLGAINCSRIRNFSLFSQKQLDAHGFASFRSIWSGGVQVNTS